MGSSALTYLYCALNTQRKTYQLGRSTLVVGEQDLWEKNNPDHEMGQPQDILYPLNASRNPRDRNAAVPSPTNSQNFLKAGSYTQQEIMLSFDIYKNARKQNKSVEFRVGRATRVSRQGNGYQVSLNLRAGGAETVTADRVVLACGAGAPMTPEDRDIPVAGREELSQNPRPYPEIISGEDYYWEYKNSLPNFRPFVCVYGASATSSWDVGNAIANSAQFVLWLAQRNFNGASPVGRNAAVITFSAEHDYMALGSISKVEVLKNVADPAVPRLRLWFGDAGQGASQALPLDQSVRKELDGGIQVLDPHTQPSWDCHQLVCALGANPNKGAAGIIDPALWSSLHAKFDSDKRCSLNGQTLVALANDDLSLLVVGAAVFRSADVDNIVEEVKRTYSSVPNLFCKATRPPEGIFALKQAMKSLTGYMESTEWGEFNWKTADRMEMYFYLARYYPKSGGFMSDAQLGQIVDDVMKKQQETEFGFTPQQFSDAVIDAGKRIVGRTLRSPLARRWNTVQAAKPIR
jgi:hypothetical protein